MLYVISLLPVLLFILLLIGLDSFSLVKKLLLVASIVWGILTTYVAGIALAYLPDVLFTAPICEELIKGVGILLLVRFKKAVFFIDSAIYGAAIGAGFALSENIHYIAAIPDMSVGIAMIRGLATAIMHCGAVASTAVLLNWFYGSRKWCVRVYLIALIPAVLIHALYNSLIMPPALSLPVVLFGVIGWFITLFYYNEKGIEKWMDLELYTEVELLSAMNRGEFSRSHAGQYMMALKREILPEIFFDMCCYVKLYFELSLAAKSKMMLAEAGMEPLVDKEVQGKVVEFFTLKKQIGTVGELALMPIVRKDSLAAWKINLMKK